MGEMWGGNSGGGVDLIKTVIAHCVSSCIIILSGNHS